MKRKIAAILLVILVLACTTVSVSGSPAAPAYDPVSAMTKDETVYIGLKADGSVAEVNVVNHLETPVQGLYTDYGTYASVANLTNTVQPQTAGDAISWPLEADSKGFYYQGTLENVQLPYLFSVAYRLDGVEKTSAEMAGKSGRVDIELKVTSNTASAEYFRKNYFCQVQLGLDLDQCANIDAEGATMVVTGRTQNLGYAVLPQKDADFHIRYETSDFSFNGFTMTCTPFSAENMTDLDLGALKDGVKQLSDGAGQMVDGTKELKSGLSRLSGGIAGMSSGAKSAVNGLNQYKAGLQSYTGGVSSLAGNAKQISDNLNALAANGQSMKNGFSQLKAGLFNLFDQMEPVAPPEMAGQLSALRGQLNEYGAGLADFTNGISSMAAGMEAFSQGLSQLDEQGAALVPGLSAIIDGMAQLTDGLSQTASQMKKLPAAVGKLIDGQIEMKDGVDEAAGKLDTFNTGSESGDKPVSFVSQKNNPRSVQFIYKTEEITQAKKEQPDPAPTQPSKDFLERFVELFK